MDISNIQSKNQHYTRHEAQASAGTAANWAKVGEDLKTIAGSKKEESAFIKKAEELLLGAGAAGLGEAAAFLDKLGVTKGLLGKLLNGIGKYAVSNGWNPDTINPVTLMEYQYALALKAGGSLNSTINQGIKSAASKLEQQYQQADAAEKAAIADLRTQFGL
jgi:hypothetical protein